MPKSLVLGNGNVLVCFDNLGRIRDFYYHRVGLENHVGEPFVHKIGVFCDGNFSWIEDDWNVSVDYLPGTMVSNVVATNKKLAVELRFSDVVHHEKNILIRRVSVQNLAKVEREIKIFFHQQFKIYDTQRKDTGYYDPESKSVIHFEGKRVFVVSGKNGKKGIDQFSIGNYGIEGKEGTWRDAEDGRLEGNPIEHGPVDSVVGFCLKLKGKKSEALYYWIGAEESTKKAVKLNGEIIKKTPEVFFEQASDFWKNWLEETDVDLTGLDKEIVSQFKKSLFIIRTHVGNSGEIIASGDSSMLEYGHGTYAFVWPRDAAFIAIALCKAGMHSLTKNFFDFCKEVISEEGFFMQKFQADRTIGSTWHPWFKNGKKQYPIQEDETALVLVALWKYYLSSEDHEFIKELYDPLIKKAADFMCEYRDNKTGLPKSSYDLWERKRGTSTFTASAVCGGLNAASNFAAILKKKKDQKLYSDVAEDIKKAINKKLFNLDDDYFYNLLVLDDDKKDILYDDTTDVSSFYGVYRFNVLGVVDDRMERVYRTVQKRLFCRTAIGGVIRFEGDDYHQTSYDAPSNPWFITTLWCAQYEIARAKNVEDLKIAKEKIDWAMKFSTKSGLMSEQVRADNGKQTSASPLTWSHAEFISTVIDYAYKLKQIEGGK